MLKPRKNIIKVNHSGRNLLNYQMNMGLSLMKNTCYEIFNRSAVVKDTSIK